MRTGMDGWHKRINRSMKQVTRAKTLNDGVDLDPTGDALGKMYNAAKTALLKRKAVIAKDINVLDSTLASCGARCEVASADDAQPEKVDEEGGSATGVGDEATSSDDEPCPSGFLASIRAFVPAEKVRKSTSSSTKNASAKATPKAKSSPSPTPKTPKAKATPKARRWTVN